MESEMEVDSTETAVGNIDESSLQTKTLSEESPDIELSSPMKSSLEIIPPSQIVSSQGDLSNQKSSPQAVPSDEVTSVQAVPSDQTNASHDMPEQAISTQDVPSDQTTTEAVSSDQGALPSEVPTSQKVSTSEAPSEVTPVTPGPSSDAVPSKMTNGPATKKQCLDFHSMSTGVYLDSTVVPILHLALVTLDRLRPADPVQYVIDFLLRHKAQYSKSKEQPASSSSANHA